MIFNPYFFYRKLASLPEDVEYFEMQQEMNEDIQKQYQNVERIIGLFIISSFVFLNSLQTF